MVKIRAPIITKIVKRIIEIVTNEKNLLEWLHELHISKINETKAISKPK